jgi:hypothetical protein
VNRSPLPALCALVALVPTALSAGEPDYIPGLWIHHDEWTMERALPDEQGNIRKHAGAAVLNFCPGGELRLATGVIYQSTKSPAVVIGASDGLAIYRGKWARVNGVVRVEYQLVDAEFADLLSDRVATERHSTELKPAKSGIAFSFVGVSGESSTLNLSPAARYGKKVLDDFVTCGKN